MKNYEKKKFPPEIQNDLERAYAAGYRYLVTIYKTSKFAKKGTFFSFHKNQSDCIYSISQSEYEHSFHILSLLIHDPDYFLRSD